MPISDEAVAEAEERLLNVLATVPHAIVARYDRRVSRIMVGLSNGLELALVPDLEEALAGAKSADLGEIDITPSGVGLHWLRLDADLYVPSLLEGVFGSPR